jgi:ribosomal silencing factor RsfS
MSPVINNTRKSKTPKVRVCASRKGQKIGPRRKIVIGEQFLGGTITGRAPNDGDAPCVYFDCAHCPDGKGECRFSLLYNGTQKSCGCGSTKSFETNQTGFANSLSSSKVSAIFTDIHQGMDQDSIAAKHKIQTYTVRFVKDRVYARLEGILPHIISEIHDLAQISVKAATSKYGFSRAEIFAINTICRQQAKAAEVVSVSIEKDAKTAWELLDTENKVVIKSEATEFYYTTMAICTGNAAKAIGADDLLKPSQLAGYKWVTDLLKSTPAYVTSEISDGFSAKAEDILSRSLKANKHRVFDAMRRSEAGTIRIISKARKSVSNTYEPFVPTLTTDDLAKGFTTLADHYIAKRVA